MKHGWIDWESDPPETKAIVEESDHFDARGMRRVYGRGDNFGRHRTFNLDIWKACDGCLHMRCWSRCQEIDDRSFEINGLDKIPVPDKESGFKDAWVPSAVRDAYEEWIKEEY